MADKKISELPLLNSVSGSSLVIPIVHDGTTVKVNLSQLGHYASQWSAKTGSANTFTGTQSIIGNVNISGKLSVNSIEAVYETSSILYTSGSTQIGDQSTDVHTIFGTVNLNGLALGTNELMAQTASQAAVNLRISSTTGSINTTTSSFNSEFGKIGSTTASLHFTTSSLNAFTGSIIGQNNTISTFTSSVNFATQSLNTQTGSQESLNTTLSIVTGSMRAEIGGIESYTASLKGQAIVSSSTQITNYYKFAQTASANTFYGVQTVSGSIDVKGGVFSVISGSANLTSSIGFKPVDYDLVQGASVFEVRHINNIYPEQLALKLSVSDTSGTLFFEKNGSVYNVLSVGGSSNILFISRNTRLLGTSLLVDGGLTGSLLATNRVVSSSNQLFELNAQTGSQDLVNLNISSVTASLIGITNTLMGFTASLDNTYATDAQLYQLYQATASIHFATQSLNTQTGSQDLVNRGISSVTGSINLTTASLIGITNGLMAFTAALDNTYATDAQLYQLYQATASIHSATASLNTQTGSQSNLNAQIGIATSSLNTFSGSIRGEVNGLEAYTASLKAAAIVSSSTQITNYYRFAETASANTFYGNQTVQGNLQLSNSNPLVYNAGNTNAMLFGFFDGSSIYGPYYQIFGSNYSNTTQRGSAEFVFDSRNGGYTGFNISEFNGSTWLRKFRVSPSGAEVTGSFVVDGGITGSLMATNNVVSSSNQVPELFILMQATSSLNTFTGSIRGEVNLLEAYTASLKGAIEVSGQNVNVLGMITAQQFNVTYVSSSVMYQSGSTKVGNTFDDRHEVTGSLSVSGSLNITGSVTINNYRIDDAWTSYTPQWTTNGTQPVLGNGTLVGYYKLIGKTCFVRTKLVAGSTTTFGSGQFEFSLPFSASADWAITIPCIINNPGYGTKIGMLNGSFGGFTNKASIIDSNGSYVTPSSPATFQDGHGVQFNGSYEIA
jgi:hypothetical protein